MTRLAEELREGCRAIKGRYHEEENGTKLVCTTDEARLFIDTEDNRATVRTNDPWATTIPLGSISEPTEVEFQEDVILLGADVLTVKNKKGGNVNILRPL